MEQEHLATYLNDHLAGAAIAIQHLEHLEAKAEDIAPALAELREEIEEDRTKLRDLMRELGIAESATRKASAWVAEKTARLKMRVDDKSGGPLRRLESLEAVALGIHGKVALWQALSAAAEIAPALRGLDYDDLAARASDQRARVETLRLEAAKTALA
jgi:chromosome segregation ATPase